MMILKKRYYMVNQLVKVIRFDVIFTHGMWNAKIRIGI